MDVIRYQPRRLRGDRHRIFSGFTQLSRRLRANRHGQWLRAMRPKIPAAHSPLAYAMAAVVKWLELEGLVSINEGQIRCALPSVEAQHVG